MKKLGLALGGGGLRGLAHIGVLQVLEENKIPVSFIAGTSAGSIAAALYASGVSPRRMEELVMSLRPRDYLDYNWSGFFKAVAAVFLPGKKVRLNGLIKGKKLERLVYNWTGGQWLSQARLPLGIVACNIDSGEEVVFTKEELAPCLQEMEEVKEFLLSKAVRASSSIPVVFVPFKWKGGKLVDGGLQEIVPVEVPKRMGAEYILAVNLGRERYDSKVNGIMEIMGRTLDILTYETSATTQELLADLVIYPQVQELSLEDIEQAPRIIRAGRRALNRVLPELKAGLNA